MRSARRGFGKFHSFIGYDRVTQFLKLGRGANAAWKFYF